MKSPAEKPNGEINSPLQTAGTVLSAALRISAWCHYDKSGDAALTLGHPSGQECELRRDGSRFHCGWGEATVYSMPKSREAAHKSGCRE